LSNVVKLNKSDVLEELKKALDFFEHLENSSLVNAVILLVDREGEALDVVINEDNVLSLIGAMERCKQSLITKTYESCEA